VRRCSKTSVGVTFLLSDQTATQSTGVLVELSEECGRKTTRMLRQRRNRRATINSLKGRRSSAARCTEHEMLTSMRTTKVR
jgi:hypothetical protein